MVLFYMEHIGSLYQIVTFRYKYHKDEEVCLIAEGKYRDVKFLYKMIDENIFSKIVFFDIAFTKTMLGNNTWENYIDNYYSNLFYDNNINLDECNAIYCTFDIFNDILLFFMKHKKNVYFIESIEGAFINDSLYSVLTNHNAGDIRHEEVNRKYDLLLGKNNRNVIKRFVWKKVLDKDVEFEFIEEFYNLDIKYINKIKSAIINEKSFLPENAVIYFLNSYGYTCPKAKEDAYVVHSIICDLFLKRKKSVWIKDHPSNAFLQQDKNITDIFSYNSLRGEVPIEFYFLGTSPKSIQIVSCNSTSNSKINQFVKQSIKLGDSVLTEWKKLFKLTVTYDIRQYLNLSFKHHYMGISRELIIKYWECMETPFPENDLLGINPSILKGKIYTIIDTINDNQEEAIHSALQNADEETIVIFFNSDSTFRFIPLTKNLINYFHVFKISKNGNNQSADYFEDEYLYVFCKSKKIGESLIDYSFDYYMKYLNCNICVERVSNTMIENIFYKKIIDNYIDARKKYEKALGLLEEL